MATDSPKILVRVKRKGFMDWNADAKLDDGTTDWGYYGNVEHSYSFTRWGAIWSARRKVRNRLRKEAEWTYL